MRRTDPRRVPAVAAVALTSALAVVLAGAGTPLSKKKRPAAPPKVEETVGNLADIFHRAEMHLEGVGLVVGLDKAGVDPPPSMYRQRLVEDMRKAGVENPNQWLKDPRVSMVIVKLTVPTGVSPTDRLDVDVELPVGCGTKNLTGGYLLATRLREMMVLNGGVHEDHVMAVAGGPVMTGSTKKPDDVKAGRVLGGGRALKEIPFQIALKENRVSVRNAAIIESVINQRFPQTKGVNQKGSATAKTDGRIELSVPRLYHENQARFFQVVRLLPIVDSPALREQRLATWGKQLLDPGKTKDAALRLEGLGVTAVETLKQGLASANPDIKFYAAEALAYLDDPSCCEILSDIAVRNQGYRPYALAALAAMDQAASHLKLRKLMDEPDFEVRYGAFNALRVASPDDPFLGQVRVLDDAPEPDSDLTSDSMAIALPAASRRKPRQDDPFTLYLIDCEGPPMVHVARTRRCEVVVFGRAMKLLPPIVLGTGPLQLNAADGDDAVQISKIVTTKTGDGDSKVSANLELGDVIRRAANLGASYPELVTILQAADRQKNLPGPLVVDALPGSSPVAAVASGGKKAKSKKDSKLQRAKLDDDSTKRRSLFDRLFNRDGK